MVLKANFYLFQSHKWEAEGLHGVTLLLVVEDHPVGGQVKPAGLVPFKHAAGLSGEVHGHIVAKQENAGKNNSNLKIRGMRLQTKKNEPLTFPPHGGAPHCWRELCSRPCRSFQGIGINYYFMQSFPFQCLLIKL